MYILKDKQTGEVLIKTINLDTARQLNRLYGIKGYSCIILLTKNNIITKVAA
jgi:hypothetical protein